MGNFDRDFFYREQDGKGTKGELGFWVDGQGRIRVWLGTMRAFGGQLDIGLCWGQVGVGKEQLNRCNEFAKQHINCLQHL